MLTPEQSDSFFSLALASPRAMVILRGYSPKRTTELAQSAWRLGFRLVEVPLQSRSAADALMQARATRQGPLGAGTITTVELVDHAAESGASFTVAPGFNPDVARRSLQRGMPHLPGVATPTDIQNAHAAGFRWMKAFPAAALGAPWIPAVLAPFPDVRFVATGGIDAQNFNEFLHAGAAAVSFGAAFESLRDADLARLA